jgi:formate dehydrogenase major subunit
VPRYRAPGSDRWVEHHLAGSGRARSHEDQASARRHWIATEKNGDEDVPVNRTDAIAFMGGAQNTNEECYLFQKAARLLGTVYVEHQARL